ncbi:hypothetical protein DY000_02022237 [Brassica cretica]|uniref:Uncharacterized protein n=1 Tax=Brassica cretica TaxID=69181 RepID=A0ABQ7EDV3_BRACR|nr:hypothetical protein DY000_02022237 [Brassica cretica]
MSKLTEASASPSPSNPTSLGETYVQNLQVLIKTPVYHLEKRLPSRTLVSIHPHEEVPTPTPTTKLRLRPLLLSLTPGSDNNNGTLVSIHPHEEVPTPTPTTKLRLRPLLLSLTPGSDNNNGPRAISGPHKQEYCDTSGLIQGVCILHKEQHAARELNSDQLPSGRMRNPNRFFVTPGPNKQPQGLKEPPGSQTTSESRRNLRVQNHLRVLNTTSGSRGTSGFPINLRVPKRPQGPNTASGSRGTSGFPIDLRVPKRPQGPKYDLMV